MLGGNYTRIRQVFTRNVIAAAMATFLLFGPNGGQASASYDDAMAAFDGRGTWDHYSDFHLGVQLLRICALFDNDIACQVELGNIYTYGRYRNREPRRVPQGLETSEQIEAYVWYFLAAINSNLQTQSGGAYTEFKKLQAEAILSCNYVTGPDFLSINKNTDFADQAVKRVVYLLKRRGAVGLRTLGQLHLRDYGLPSGESSGADDLVMSFPMMIATATDGALRGVGRIQETIEEMVDQIDRYFATRSIERRVRKEICEKDKGKNCRDSGGEDGDDIDIYEDPGATMGELVREIRLLEKEIDSVIRLLDVARVPKTSVVEAVEELQRTNERVRDDVFGRIEDLRDGLSKLNEELSVTQGVLSHLRRLADENGDAFRETLRMYKDGEGCPNLFAQDDFLARRYFEIAKDMGDDRSDKLLDSITNQVLTGRDRFRDQARRRRAIQYPDPTADMLDYLYPPAGTLSESILHPDVSVRLSRNANELSRMNDPRYNVKASTTKALDVLSGALIVHGINYKAGDGYKKKVKEFQKFLLAPVTGTLTPWEEVTLIKYAARAGEKDFQHTLGRMYYYGVGVRKNIDVAHKLFRDAADQGHLKSICLMYRLSQNDRAFPQNRAETLHYEDVFKKKTGKGMGHCNALLGQ